MIFRIYTEDKNEVVTANIVKEVSKAFDGFTVINGMGFWKGIPERALIIEVVTDFHNRFSIYSVAEQIKEIGKQDAVLITEMDGKERLV